MSFISGIAYQEQYQENIYSLESMKVNGAVGREYQQLGRKNYGLEEYNQELRGEVSSDRS